jgi:hypothetical protein
MDRIIISVALMAMASDAFMHPTFRLNYFPKRALPEYSKVVHRSTNGAGKLHSLVLPPKDEYSSGPIQLIELEGSPANVGEAYGELLGVSAQKGYKIQTTGKAALLPVLDFLWDCSLASKTPQAFIEEMEGMKKGGSMVKVVDLDVMIKRMVTAASLPEDTQNIEALVARETARHHNKTSCGMRGAKLFGSSHNVIAEASHGPGHCDFFAVWGNMTEGGRLLSTRNLDIGHDTGLAMHKLITVYRIDGQVPYATFGFTGFAGALAGNSKRGLTVSEANLDNGAVAFDGLAWPLRLRHILGNARNLTQARSIWKETPNTAGRLHSSCPPLLVYIIPPLLVYPPSSYTLPSSYPTTHFRIQFLRNHFDPASSTTLIRSLQLPPGERCRACRCPRRSSPRDY